jgi:cyclopropane-fatty-acyl-phospholipid synthase
MLLQAITIADQRYQAALGEVDFIQKHIFPGGFLPSVTALAAAMTRASRPARRAPGGHRPPLRRDPGALARQLPRAPWTPCAPWATRNRFIRMWLFYLAYCEAGFRERDLGTVQMLLAKPGWRGAPVLGQLADTAGSAPC